MPKADSAPRRLTETWGGAIGRLGNDRIRAIVVSAHASGPL
jgi:hypothetical protein